MDFPTLRPHAARTRLLAAVLGVGLIAIETSAAQGTLDQLSPGPYPTATWDWDFGNVQTSNPSSGNPINVNHYGQLTYPSDGSGGALPPVATPPADGFPLIVFGHGRFFQNGVWQTNHLQAAYLMERLASWGIVSTSVNLGVVGQFGSPAAIPQRGDIIIETFNRTLDLGSQPGTPPAGLAAAIDAARLGVIGHSRGGEGAVAAAIQNLLAGSPLPILAVGTISPTDFEQYELPASMPYMGLYGSKDGDVNNGWPIRLHDRNDSAEKLFEYIHGANHFWFTESITFSVEGSGDISRDLHHDIAMGYFAGFMVQKLGIENGTAGIFADGAELAPLTTQAEILPMYRASDRLVIDDFQSNPSLTLTSANTLAASGGFNYAFEDSLNQQAFSYYHLTSGVVAGWVGAGGIWFAGVPAGADPSAYPFLSVKFSQRLEASLNTVGQSQDLSVGVFDEDGDLAVVRLSDFGDIPYPATHPGGGIFGPTFPKKTVLRTTRIPMSALEAANPAIDLDRLLFIGWQPDQTATGEVAFDNMEFTQ